VTGREAAKEIRAIAEELEGVASVRDQQALRELAQELATARDEETLLALVSEAKTIRQFWDAQRESVLAPEPARRWDRPAK
jgi:hypothetical protein